MPENTDSTIALFHYIYSTFQRLFSVVSCVRLLYDNCHLLLNYFAPGKVFMYNEYKQNGRSRLMPESI